MQKIKNIKQIKKISLVVFKKNDVVKAGIFGSFARGENFKKSDIDFLIKFKGKKSLLDLVGLKQELEEKLKRRVDIVTYTSLSPLLKDRILEEEVKIL